MKWTSIASFLWIFLKEKIIIIERNVWLKLEQISGLSFSLKIWNLIFSFFFNSIDFCREFIILSYSTNENFLFSYFHPIMRFLKEVQARFCDNTELGLKIPSKSGQSSWFVVMVNKLWICSFFFIFNISFKTSK